MARYADREVSFIGGVPLPPQFDFAQVLIDQTQVEGKCVKSLKHHIEISYKERLY